MYASIPAIRFPWKIERERERKPIREIIDSNYPQITVFRLNILSLLKTTVSRNRETFSRFVLFDEVKKETIKKKELERLYRS